MTVTSTDNNATKYVKNISYDGYDRVTKENYGTYAIGTEVQYPDSNNSPEERVETLKHILSGTIDTTSYTYDGLKRLSEKQMVYSGTKVYRHKYTYHAGKSGTNETTGLTKSEELYLKNSQSPAEQYEYTYDANGNVTKIEDKITGKKTTYSYDGLNRLVFERNEAIGNEYTYTYDNGGNITCKRQFNSTVILTGTTNYGYGDSYWKDQLTNWGSYGTSSFAYDSSGNPTKYKGKTLTWQGKKLIKYANSALSYMDLSYDGNGMLVGYTQNDTYSDWAGAQFTNVYSREITRDGDRILSEKVTSIDGSLLTNDVKTVNYAYDERGASGMRVNGKYYYFVRNLFGDVTAIYDNSGVKKAEYSYDAWGTCYTTLDTDGLGSLNPFRYRGYYYISRIGLYYLTTRFYDYMTGRFVNADVPSICIDDGLEIPEGSNLYSYCLNNPISNIDPTGHFFTFLIGLGIFIGIGAAVGGVTYATSELLSYAITGESSWSWGMFAGSIIGGAIGGALSFLFPAAPAYLIGGITGFSATMSGMGLQNVWEGKKYSFGQILATSFLAGSVSAVTAGMLDNLKITGLNSGRGSFQQVTRQVRTKFWNGTIKRVTGKTLAKMSGLMLYQSCLDMFVNSESVR